MDPMSPRPRLRSQTTMSMTAPTIGVAVLPNLTAEDLKDLGVCIVGHLRIPIVYTRANGCNYEATKIFMPANAKEPVYAPYVEHVPPDVTAC